MNWILEAGLAVSMVALCAGLMGYLIISKVMRTVKELESPKTDIKNLEKRVKNLEQRVTDMQEIVLSIDEHLNHSQDEKMNRIKPSQSPVETA